jgi:hypothetical protein
VVPQHGGKIYASGPIGLKGGFDLYGYADDAPIDSDDPLGLASKKRKDKPPRTPPPTDCPTICNMAYADPRLNEGGGGPVCLNGVKCPCAFDVPFTGGVARRGECPDLDAEVMSHETKHLPETWCPSPRLCRGKFPIPTDGNRLECQHRRESTMTLMRAINIGNVTPICKQKMNMIVKDIQGWIHEKCH